LFAELHGMEILYVIAYAVFIMFLFNIQHIF
jgi:hypothetical protein